MDFTSNFLNSENWIKQLIKFLFLVLVTNKINLSYILKNIYLIYIYKRIKNIKFVNYEKMFTNINHSINHFLKFRINYSKY